MINTFLDWAQEQPNVWIVSTWQLLQWVMDPKPVSQLDQSDALKCATPSVTAKICNGMPQNEAGLVENCPFSDTPFGTCVSVPCLFFSLFLNTHTLRLSRFIPPSRGVRMKVY
jgi:hypothetical protein